MIKRISTVVAVMGAAGVISGCAIEQPSAGCFVQDASFANWSGKYTLVSQPDAAVTCDDLTGDVLGVWKYFDPDASAETVAQNRAAKLAIRPRRAAQITAYTYQFQKKDPTTGAPLVYPNGEPQMGSEVFSRLAPGVSPAVATSMSTTFANEPNAEGMCLANGFNESRVEALRVPDRDAPTDETKDVQPATTRIHQFSDVEVYSAPSAPGTQLRGKLTYSTVNPATGQVNCTAQYEVWALWPISPCDPASELASEKCGEGSGLNPDFDVVCDTTQNRTVVRDTDADGNPIYWPGICATARRPPSFKNQ